MSVQTVPPNPESIGRREPRRVRYWKAAIAGGILWEILGITFGERLLDHSFTWEAQTLSQQWAEIGFCILALPFALILASIEESIGGFLFISFFLNGSLWGLLVAMVFNKISARRRIHKA